MVNHRLATAASLLQSQATGDDYDAKSFVNATWVFLEALKEVANGKALLDEWGEFVAASTSSDEYGQAWQIGVNRCQMLTPHEPTPVHAHDVTTKQSHTHYVEDWLLEMRSQQQGLRWDHELETLEERLESLLDRPLDDESRADLSQWWRAVRAIRSRAALICADGCAVLKSLSDRGIESWHVSFLKGRHIGNAWAVDVKGAVAAIVQQLPDWQPTQRHAPTEPEDTTGGKRPAYNRDHLFLKWYEDEGEPTHRSYSAIRDKWNRLSEAQRMAIAPNCHHSIPKGRSGTDRVKAAIRKARKP